MNLELILTKEAFEALCPELKDCYRQNGQSFGLDLTPFDTGPSSSDALMYARRREQAARVMHGKALAAAGVPADKLDLALSQTRCSISEEGTIEVCVTDPETGLRLSANSFGVMSLQEFIESLKPKTPVDDGTPIGGPDRIIENRVASDGSRITRFESGRVLVDGQDASKVLGSRLMSLGTRPTPAKPVQTRAAATVEFGTLSGAGLMRLARSEEPPRRPAA